MMKTFVTLAAFAAGSNALVSRGDSCCFHLTASGGASGSVGQLSDGQNRIGDSSLSPAQYCINSSGGITDSHGRGCILTPPTTQFQCDQGASPTTGFSVSSSGQLEYNGSPQFIACETGQNHGLNIYTKNSTAVTQCVNVNLKADSCSGSGSGAGASSSSVPAMSSWVSTPAQSASASSAPASSAPASSAPSVPGGPVSSAQCMTGSPVTTTVTVTDCSCATSGAPVPGGGGSYPSGSSSVMPSGPAGGSQDTSTVMSTPSGPAGGAQSSTPTGGSQPSTMTSVPVSSATAHGSCPTTLSSDNYQYPHLIIPVDSASPSTAPGTSYNGTVTSTISSIFNFDIPKAYSDKTCSLVFLFPKKADLETSSYSFSGDGKIDVSKLSAVASESTSYSNAPSVAQDLGDITISPGNSYVVDTFACPAGEAIAFEMKNAGSTNLNFFEDWNPSPLGLFITSC
ncbi:uncharacterized protein N7498_006648 [Penicillium cinerascens]|uniref:Ubiquitin 3 binding protein But2 C-terminal domain-containing protein n=1 Tax=Penicillium cinerascens TaxID=70096 RepID=A0A9W9MIN3_9EURO|nr:uncharacterized protein N7498_006648 [Penicillium cinerascens]KAJ5201985.1 hypothetical protein N7498_006648 [Penicillium cinerascens]